MLYWIKTHWIVKKIFPNFIWDIPNNEGKVYLTFDDGPTPDVTEWVLNQLKKYNTKATFFCIGDNIDKHPDIFRKIIDAGHIAGNHTYSHLNGWEHASGTYLESVMRCATAINVNNHKRHNLTVGQDANQDPQSKVNMIFRPPYGKLKYSQADAIRKLGYKIVMWEVLSADFDTSISKEQCLRNVLKNIRQGSIVIFHDSHKAFPHLHYVLPRVLQYMRESQLVGDTI